jgi:hypothetical protein
MARSFQPRKSIYAGRPIICSRPENSVLSWIHYWLTHLYSGHLVVLKDKALVVIIRYIRPAHQICWTLILNGLRLVPTSDFPNKNPL